MPNPLDYDSPPPPPSPRATLQRAAVLAALALAALQLIFVQLDVKAPLRMGFGADTPLAQLAARRAAFAAPIVRLAAGRNIELHFAEPSPPPEGADFITPGVYYGLNYALFPARAFVGDDRRIINDGVTLRAADVVPTNRWLHDHGVGTVWTFPMDAQGLRRPTVRPVR